MQNSGKIHVTEHRRTGRLQGKLTAELFRIDKEKSCENRAVVL